MKKLILHIVFVFIFCYFCTIFTLWELNPKEWGENIRAIFITVFCFLTLAVTLKYVMIEDDNVIEK